MNTIFKDHLIKLKEKFYKYFHLTKDINKNNTQVIHPFVQSDENNPSLINEEQVMDLNFRLNITNLKQKKCLSVSDKGLK